MTDDTPFSFARGAANAGEPFEVGDRVSGYYHLRRILGRGGMAYVFEADDKLLSRRVAIKVVDDPQLGAEMLVREAIALSAVRHPGLPVVYGLGVHHGWTYLVLERLYGVTLEQHLDRSPERRLGVDEALPILVSLADVLAAVHAAGMAHRDLKPGNVVLAPAGRTVLLDFGIVLPEVSALEVERCGTPRYLAPEVINGTVVRGEAHLVDTYAFGTMAFEMLAGRVPFEANTLIELMEQHLSTPPPTLRQVRPGIPSALSDLVLGCMAKNPSDRPRDMQTILWELHSLRRRSVEESGPVRLPAGTRTSTREIYRRAATPPPVEPESTPWEVLIVEDDEDIRDGLASVLKARGFRTRVAADGHDALELIRRKGWRPSVILLDLMMPVMDGRQFLASQADDPFLEGIPVLLVTAQPSDDVRSFASVRGVVPKPLEMPALLQLVREVCRRNTQHA
jgi:serine/threonine protein kinase